MFQPITRPSAGLPSTTPPYEKISASSSLSFIPSWGQTIRSILTGRISPDWRNSIYKTVTILHIIAFAYCFFAGYWVLASIFLISIGIDALIQRDIKDLGSHKALNQEYQKQNSKYVLNNIQYMTLNREQKETLESFKIANKNLEETKDKLVKENTAFSENNVTYGTLLKTMNDDLEKCRTQITALTEGGEEKNKQILSELQTTSEDFQSRIDTIKELHRQIEQNEKETNQVVQELSTQLKKSTSTHLQLVKDSTIAGESLKTAKFEVDRLQTHITNLNGEVVKLVEQREALGTEITALTKIRQDITALLSKSNK